MVDQAALDRLERRTGVRVTRQRQTLGEPVNAPQYQSRVPVLVAGIVLPVLDAVGIEENAWPGIWAIAGWSLGLWCIAMVSFFPIIGWGVAGGSVPSSVAMGALGPHLMFGILLWEITKMVFCPPSYPRM